MKYSKNKMMQDETVKLLPLELITVDPDQPRKTFEDIRHLADSMKRAGLLHPIVVDNNYKIIVGERRYKAAQMLKWKIIRATIESKKLSPYERLLWQLIENVQQSSSKGGKSMKPIETAKTLVKLYELKTGKGYEPGSHPLLEIKTKGGIQKVGAFEVIAKEASMSKHTVWELVVLLEETLEVQHSIENGMPRTYFREANKAPEKFKRPIKKKIIVGDYSNREDVARDVKLAQTNPQLALYSLVRKRRQESKEVTRILDGVINLGLALEAVPFSKIVYRERNVVRNQLLRIQGEIDEYLIENITPKN